MLVVASAITVHRVGSRTLMLVSTSALTVHGLDIGLGYLEC